jgi:hypothetical protein
MRRARPPAGASLFYPGLPWTSGTLLQRMSPRQLAARSHATAAYYVAARFTRGAARTIRRCCCRSPTRAASCFTAARRTATPNISRLSATTWSNVACRARMSVVVARRPKKFVTIIIASTGVTPGPRPGSSQNQERSAFAAKCGTRIPNNGRMADQRGRHSCSICRRSPPSSLPIQPRRC